MSIKTILVDPGNNYEALPSSKEMVEAYNRTVPAKLRITMEEQEDLNQMFLEAGLLEEVIIQ